MTEREFYIIQELKEDIEFWEEKIKLLKRAKSYAGNEYGEKQSTLIELRKRDKRKNYYEVNLIVMGRIGHITLPKGSIDVLIDYAEKQLKITQEKFKAIQIKEQDDEQ